MNMTKEFLDQWITFEIFETETKGVYEINCGITFNGDDVSLTVEGFDILFGENKHEADCFEDYGFNSVDEFKRAAVSCLYYTCLSSALTLVGQHIVNLLRNNTIMPAIDAKRLIYGGRASDIPQMYSLYMDLRSLNAEN